MEYKNIQDFSKKYRGTMYFSVVLLCLSILFGIVPYFALYHIIDRSLSGAVVDFEYAIKIAMVIGGGFLLKHILYFQGLDQSHNLAYRTLGDMREKLADKFLKLPMGTIHQRGHGEIKKNFVENIEEMEVLLAHHIPEGISNIIMILMTLVVMFFIDWRMTLIGLLVVPIGLAVFTFNVRLGTTKMDQYYKTSKAMNDTIVEYVNGMEAIKVFNRAAESYEKYTNVIKDYHKFTIDWFKQSYFYASIYGSVLPATLLFLLPAGIYFYLGASLSLAKMILLILLSMTVGTSLLRFVDFMPKMYALKYKSDQIISIFAEKELDLNGQLDAPKNNNISFENISFSYDQTEVIKNLSLELKENSLNALVGESGAGKSTLAKLLVRFWDVNKGEIKIGDVNIKDIKFDSLMNHISYVSQDNFLFNTSIEENIGLGNPSASKEDIIVAAKAASCHEFIMKKKDGYSTLVGESGNSLSGGEKQRITLARAILKNAPIIVLDEATSFTDPENEDIIQEAIGNLIQNKTVIVIAHRLSTIVDADKIIVLDRGEISGEGRHDDLLETNEIYKRLYNAHEAARNWEIGGSINV